MDLSLRIFSISVSALVFFSVIYMLVKRKLNESNSILWLLIGFVTLLSGFFPEIMNHAAAIVGIEYPPALLFLLAIITLLLIVFKCSMEISKSQAKIDEIAITLAILREENKQLATKLTGNLHTEVTDEEKVL